MLKPFSWLRGAALVVALLACGLGTHRLTGAEIEFLSGNKLTCKVLEKSATTLKVEVEVNGKTIERTYQLSTVHAVTINDKRYVINEKSARPQPGAPKEAPAEVAGGSDQRRTKAQIDALIENVGREPPEWFADTQLNLPATLDMSWPLKPEGGWNNQKNVGQYVWDIINPNPNKWREGVKLMHELLKKHQDDPEKRTRAMIDIGRMYHDLHEDYARAAFWWRKAGLDVANSREVRHTADLAGCYFRLGNKQMAIDLLSKQPHTVFSAKLWADIGDMTKSVAVADVFVRQKVNGTEVVLLHVADGFRQAGKPKEAAQWYQRVIDYPAEGMQKDRIQKTQARARASLEALRLYELVDLAKIKDGVYPSQSQGYEGPVHVAVTVKSGRIEEVRVTQHKEKQFYSALSDTPAKIIARQGVKGVDATSNATITSEAIINATAKALASGAP